MGLLDTLHSFGFPPSATGCMARHMDSQMGRRFWKMIDEGQFEEYQRWQVAQVYDGEFLVSFVGDGPKRARLWGIYKLHKPVLIPQDKLPRRPVLWNWAPCPHWRYSLTRLPEYDLLAENLVISWSSERKWVQHIKNNLVLESSTYIDIHSHGDALQHQEGKQIARMMTIKKRNRQARNACLAIHGAKCSVCEMTFPERYSGLGKGFMHVHHLTAMADREHEYLVDARDELIPVCPNCHAMLHWELGRPMTIEQLQGMLSVPPQHRRTTPHR
jgi:hypothetical protein